MGQQNEPAPADFSPSVNELVGNNAAQADGFNEADQHSPPVRHLAIVTCMDSRIDAVKVLGLGEGDAHILRNAGGVITDDVVRSLCLSQRFLGTREIILMHHTDCGLQNLDEDLFRDGMESEVGVAPGWALETFTDPYDDVRASMQRLLDSPFVAHKEHISGFVYDVTDGLLHTVD